MVGKSSLSKILFCTSLKFCGLGLKCFKERYYSCKFNNMTSFLLREEETNKFMIWQLNREAEIWKVEKSDENKYFIDWYFNHKNLL